MVIVAVFEKCCDSSILRAQQRVCGQFTDVAGDPGSRTPR
jgi:hypothetical protein